MKRVRTTGKVTAKKESEVRPGVFYVTAETKDWGTVKVVSTKKRLQVGDDINLITQKLRAYADAVRWEEDSI